mgnify:CR=1 FL=1
MLGRIGEFGTIIFCCVPDRPRPRRPTLRFRLPYGRPAATTVSSLCLENSDRYSYKERWSGKCVGRSSTTTTGRTNRLAGCAGELTEGRYPIAHLPDVRGIRRNCCRLHRSTSQQSLPEIRSARSYCVEDAMCSGRTDLERDIHTSA